MAFANMGPKPAIKPPVPAVPPARESAVQPATVAVKQTLAPQKLATMPPKKKRVHTYKLVVTSVLGLMGFGIFYGYYSFTYTYTPAEYIASDTLAPIDLVAIAKARTLTNEEKTRYYKEYVRARELAKLQAVYVQVTSGAANDSDHATAVAQLGDLEWQALDDEHRTLREKFKLSGTHEQEIFAYGNSANPVIEPYNYPNSTKIAFDGVALYMQTTKDSVEKAAASFSIAGALGNQKSADISLLLQDNFTEQQKDVSALAMLDTLERYQLDESIFTGHASAEVPPPEIIEPPVNLEPEVTVEPTPPPPQPTPSPTSAPKPAATPEPEENPILIPTTEPEPEPEVQPEDETTTSSSVSSLQSSSSSSYLRINKRSLRENFDWYQSRDR